MCGIAGRVAVGGRELAPVEAQLSALRHRGPDSTGWFSRGSAAIGQARLAIIDLVTGDPPITNEDGSIGVALNGEIYNFPALRTQLEAEGHRFHTSCDTEVIAHLAEQRKPADIARALDGMFAAAIWDDRRQRLVLIRDRVGKKPLYYWTDGQTIVFGSEIKALLACPDVPRQLNHRAIPAYLTFGYVPTPETFFKDIVSLPPGHVLTFDRAGEVTIDEYWSVPCPGIDTAHLDLGVEEVAVELRSLLRRAVERRLMADVPLGAFLSGGIDSSAIVGLMSELMEQPVRTFTMGFEGDPQFDERDHARRVAHRFRSHHEEFVVRPAAVELVERLVWHHDQPFGDSSAIPTYLLSELTKQEVTVALAGDGGDELFAGYERFAAALLVRGYQRVPAAARDVVSSGLARVPAEGLGGRVGSAQRFIDRGDMGLPDAYLSWLSYADGATRQRLLGRDDLWATSDYAAKWEETDGARYLDRLLNLNFRTYLLDDLLVKVDRMSMAHGLEVRCPFLDRDLIEFAMRIPPNMKVRGPRLKYVLKRAIGDLIPVDLVNRRKRGFGVPLARWFRTDLVPFVDATLGASDARVKEHLHSDALNDVIQTHRAGGRDLSHLLWALLTLEVFLRREGW
jgi:asparagine synthase (glutamine-hydrolysing)